MDGAVRSGTAELVNNSNVENRRTPAPSLKCSFVKARGLVSEIDILKSYVEKLKLDIIRKAESCLNDEVM